MIRIQLRPNEPLESALRRFKRQCNYAGIFRLAKKYNFFEKKSDRERRERRERIRTMQRAQRRAMGPTKVRRAAKKPKVKRGGFDTSEAESATAAALEQKGKELLKSMEAGQATPASAADVAAAIRTRPESGVPSPGSEAPANAAE
ncbi:MAG: 30S ribosomal protein S21 [Planctomycetes bacterium]|nr:30S ribosomal protein S21 [Planctomycetota bacterium]